jgi:catechol 2,3-dioxygenase-like lactoylglutathione lyase family enzyme
MVALWARNWAAVEAFHAAALAHGGTSEGAPGLRLLYNPDFYAAYVRDPDGNKLAVVCRGFTTAQGQ